MDRDTIQRFELLGVLGVGGMGTVYRARDPQLDREVAIKVLGAGTTTALASHHTIDLRAGGHDGDALLAEARIMASLSHPNVLPIYEVGVADGALFLVMEYVAGANLRAWATTDRPTVELRAACAQAIRGLAAAHAHGIVHRDFKPDNVLVGADGRVRVCDFGLGLVAPRRPSMMRLADTRGTPRYMAPELRRGDAATIASDAYAVCASLTELLEGRAVAPPLRATLAAGLADDPGARPPLAMILAALDGPRARRPWLVAGGAVALAGASVAIWAVASRADGPACVAPTAPDRVALAAALTPRHTPEIDDAARRILARFDATATEIATTARAVCEARARGDLGEQQAAIRGGCAERRALALASDARWLAARPWDLLRAEEVIQRAPGAADCAELTAPPLPPDRGPVAAAWDRFARSEDAPAGEIAELTAIIDAAERLGEQELIVRAKLSLARRLVGSDQLAASDAQLRDAYRVALAIHADDLAALVLAERSRVASRLGDPAATTNYAQLAADVAGRATTSPAVRARIYYGLGRAEWERGDFRAATRTLRHALATIADAHLAMPALEASIRFDIVTAMNGLDDQAAAAVRLAQETSAWALATFGAGAITYGVSLNVIAMALAVNGDHAGALPYRQRALAIYAAQLPAEHSRVLIERHDIGEDLAALGEYATAATEFAAVVAAAEHNEALRQLRPDVLDDLGDALAHTGKLVEGLALIEQALELATASLGAHHPDTSAIRFDLIDHQLEAGRLDEAARQIATAEAAYAEQPAGATVKLAVLHGAMAGRLALGRDRPGDAEALARTALAALVEVNAPPAAREPVLVVLGRALLAARRAPQARPPLEEALAIATARHAPAAVRAAIEALVRSATGS